MSSGYRGRCTYTYTCPSRAPCCPFPIAVCHRFALITREEWDSLQKKMHQSLPTSLASCVLFASAAHFYCGGLSLLDPHSTHYLLATWLVMSFIGRCTIRKRCRSNPLCYSPMSSSLSACAAKHWTCEGFQNWQCSSTVVERILSHWCTCKPLSPDNCAGIFIFWKCTELQLL